MSVPHSRRSKPVKVHDGRRASSRGGLPKQVSEVLGAAFRRLGIEEDLMRYQFVLHWQDIVGEAIAKKAKPERINKNSLVIRVANSAWAQELSFHKDLILKRLQKYLNHDQKLEEIYFVVGEV